MIGEGEGRCVQSCARQMVMMMDDHDGDDEGDDASNDGEQDGDAHDA